MRNRVSPFGVFSRGDDPKFPGSVPTLPCSPAAHEPLGRLCRRTRTRPCRCGSEEFYAVSSPGFCSCFYETEIPLRRPSWREPLVSIHWFRTNGTILSPLVPEPRRAE